jgi:hypothetical protein
MSYKNIILDRIEKGEHFSDWNNYGRIFEISEDLVAKVFVRGNLEKESKKEFDNLEKITNFNDDRLNVPRPYELVELPTLGELSNLATYLDLDLMGTPSNENKAVYAVVMDKIIGTTLKESPFIGRLKYLKQLRAMGQSMLEHGLQIYDIQEREIFLNSKPKKVSFVDTHIAEWVEPGSESIVNTLSYLAIPTIGLKKKFNN